jgi:hypothetical protein
MKRKYLILLILIIGVGLFIAATSVNYTRLNSSLTVSEELTTPSIAQEVKHNDLNEVINFRPSGDSVTTDVDNVYSAILSNSGTIDLTSLTNTLGNSLDLTNEKVMAVKFKAKSDNDSIITITQGSSNPYDFMSTTFNLKLRANQSLLYKCDTANGDVGASAKTIDYTLKSTGADTLYVLLISAELY